MTLLKIDLVAPPFGGHLFPLLELGRFLQPHSFRLRVLSTQAAKIATQLSGLEHVTLLAGKDTEIEAIANPPYRVKNNPLRLMQQLEANLELTKIMKAELAQLWQDDKPDVVIADFTLPIAGILAEALGILWWTTLPTPCALESKTGTPSYLGGWSPQQGRVAKIRDALGRRLIRNFKRLIGWHYRAQLKELGIARLYRDNGDELIYSSKKIFALGMREFELERGWPEALTFVGPLTESPPYSHTPPHFENGKHYVLVTLGTHIPWAKQAAAEFIQQVARELPETVFHFSLGQADGQTVQRSGNVIFYAYIPYHLYMPHYRAAIIHGGTGITYSCIKAGVPILVWPHDYDQFDHAIRIVHHGLGFRLNPTPEASAAQLRTLMTDTSIRNSVRFFKEQAKNYHAGQSILDALHLKASAQPEPSQEYF
jgi:UDP:flavonoid glycosyltransferase YjiC (YdhE family)